MLWYERETEENGPVLSTRVRFARNLADTPFPGKLNGDGRKKTFARVRDALLQRDFAFVDFGEASELVKNAYVQTHQASAALARQGAGSGLALSRDGAVSLMINEEDHLRLQVIQAGKKLRETFDRALAEERALEEALPVAFLKPYGYLTACPTNLGAAMRISVMIHLPALQETGRLPAVARALNRAGGAVRGLFGEGSRGDGAIYQISNQNSGEKTPEEILSEFEKLLERVESEEAKARDALVQSDRAGLEDRVFRALGTLRYARRMSYEEFLTLYSRLRLGKEMGVPELESVHGLDRMLVELMPAPMVLSDASLEEETKRDEARSQRLRERLSERK